MCAIRGISAEFSNVVGSVMADNDLNPTVLRVIKERNRRENEKDFAAWCDYLVILPANFELKPKDDFKADIELQPLRWMDSGIDLIQSSKVLVNIQLPGGVEGPPLSSYLPYPVFQMGTEIFLKGMWLCQYRNCRLLAEASYVDGEKRQRHFENLKSLSHDLIKIIDAVRKIPKYRGDAWAIRFLKIVEGIIRRYYFPLYQADRWTRWADSRYPKRFYNDSAREARADNFKSYPQQVVVAKLFQEAEQRINRLWNLRDELSSRTKSARVTTQ